MEQEEVSSIGFVLPHGLHAKYGPWGSCSPNCSLLGDMHPPPQQPSLNNCTPTDRCIFIRGFIFSTYFQQDYDYLDEIRGFFFNVISEFVSKGINQSVCFVVLELFVFMKLCVCVCTLESIAFIYTCGRGSTWFRWGDRWQISGQSRWATQEKTHRWKIRTGRNEAKHRSWSRQNEYKKGKISRINQELKHNNITSLSLINA